MIKVHPTAEVSHQAQIGEGTQIWRQAQVRDGARLGRYCILGKGVYVDCTACNKTYRQPLLLAEGGVP